MDKPHIAAPNYLYSCTPEQRGALLLQAGQIAGRWASTFGQAPGQEAEDYRLDMLANRILALSAYENELLSEPLPRPIPPEYIKDYERYAAELSIRYQTYSDALSDINLFRIPNEQIPVLAPEEIQDAFRIKFAEWAANGSLRFVDDEIRRGRHPHIFLSPNTVLTHDEQSRLNAKVSEDPQDEGKRSENKEGRLLWTAEELCPVRPGGSPINFSLVFDEFNIPAGTAVEQKLALENLQQRYPSIYMLCKGDALFRVLALKDSGELYEADNEIDLTYHRRVDLEPRDYCREVRGKAHIVKTIPYSYVVSNPGEETAYLSVGGIGAGDEGVRVALG